MEVTHPQPLQLLLREIQTRNQMSSQQPTLKEMKVEVELGTMPQRQRAEPLALEC